MSKLTLVYSSNNLKESITTPIDLMDLFYAPGISIKLSLDNNMIGLSGE